METKETDKSLKTAKILYVALMVAVLIYLNVLVTSPPPPPFKLSRDTLELIAIGLAILSVLDLLSVYFLTVFMIKRRNGVQKQSNKGFNWGWFKTKSRTLSVFITRSAVIEAIAIYGLVLGVLGASLEVVIPFFIVTIMGLIIAFPTKRRWSKIALILEPPADKDPN